MSPHPFPRPQTRPEHRSFTTRDLIIILLEGVADIMASVAELQAAADAAAAAQAATLLQIAQLADQVATIIANGAGGIAPADLDPILAGLNAITATETSEGAAVDAVVDVPGEAL